MERIRLGKTNMMVSRLGFGSVPIQRLSEDEAVAIIRRCLELEVNFLDTANSYTTSEERIGKAISGQRQGLILATKSYARTCNEIESHLELSLKRLGVDTIDLYQFHDVSDFETLDMVLDPKGPMAVLKKAKKEGLIKHIGITSHSSDVAKEAVKTDRFEAIQLPFNLVNCEGGEELLPLAREHDVGFIAMKPLAGGRLENATITFRYLLQFPDIVPIPGIEKKGQIEEIIQLLDRPRRLTEAEKLEMQRLRDELGTRFCRRCDYCQPCTMDIPISVALTISPGNKCMPPEQVFHSWIGKTLEKAADCTECGDCEERCPYHLPIREMLAQEVEWYQEEKHKYQERLSSR